MAFLTSPPLARLAAALALCCALLSPGAVAQVAAPAAAAPSSIVSTQSVYAAFTLNLTRFITWPENAFPAKDAPLVVGTFLRDPINAELDATLAGETVNEHPIHTVRLRSLDDIAKCHVVFVSRSYNRIPAVLERTEGRPILTISDASGFLELGGHVRFVPQAAHIGLSISAANLKASRLEARAQLLRVFATTP